MTTTKESTAPPRLVRVPEPLHPLFSEAERLMAKYFAELERRPEEARVMAANQRYLLVRSESFSLELHEELRRAFGEAGARQIRYRIARAIGIRDARLIIEKLGVTDPLMKLALGPVHFAHVGWASVHIFDDSRPSTDEECFLHYAHPESFEAHAFTSRGESSKEPVCVMNAGYSSGWCQIAFGVELKAEEIACKAAGHDQCLFVMASPKKLDAIARDYREKLAAKASAAAKR
jgi:uncharacterized protein